MYQSKNHISSTLPVPYGRKRYELSDWLGNVRAVVSDAKVPTSGVVLYKPVVLNVTDYYSFGLSIAGRSYSNTTGTYRYSFNGKEDVEQRWYQDYVLS